MSFKGMKNKYTCTTCGVSFITVDRDEGTTPFTCACINPVCGGGGAAKGSFYKTGMAQSSMYRIDQSLKPTHEWYRPTEVEAQNKPPNWRQHYEMGGLFLRRIEDVRKT